MGGVKPRLFAGDPRYSCSGRTHQRSHDEWREDCDIPPEKALEIHCDFLAAGRAHVEPGPLAYLFTARGLK